MFDEDGLADFFIKALLETEPQAPLVFVLMEKSGMDQDELAGRHFDGSLIRQMMRSKDPALLDVQQAFAPLDPNIIGELEERLVLDYMRYSGYKKMADAGRTPLNTPNFDITSMHAEDANLILIQIS